MTELMRINVSGLTNKELGKSILTINKAINDGQKSGWVVARELNRICQDELFYEDFDDKKTFATFVGLSPSYLTQCMKAVDFADNHQELDIPVGKAYLLSTVDYFEDFDAWVVENYDGFHSWEFGDNTLKTMIKDYNSKDEEVEEVEEVETETDDIDDAMSIMVEVVDNEGTKYIVPLSVLNQYRA